MHGSRLNLFALLLILGATIMAPTSASADCSASVGKYGHCVYKGDLLFCGTCALHDSQGGSGVCNRCGTGYRCEKNSCAVPNNGCGYEYTCDLCGCSWGPPTLH